MRILKFCLYIYILLFIEINCLENSLKGISANNLYALPSTGKCTFELLLELAVVNYSVEPSTSDILIYTNEKNDIGLISPNIIEDNNFYKYQVVLSTPVGEFSSFNIIVDGLNITDGFSILPKLMCNNSTIVATLVQVLSSTVAANGLSGNCEIGLVLTLSVPNGFKVPSNSNISIHQKEILSSSIGIPSKSMYDPTLYTYSITLKTGITMATNLSIQLNGKVIAGKGTQIAISPFSCTDIKVNTIKLIKREGIDTDVNEPIQDITKCNFILVLSIDTPIGTPIPNSIDIQMKSNYNRIQASLFSTKVPSGIAKNNLNNSTLSPQQNQTFYSFIYVDRGYNYVNPLNISIDGNQIAGNGTKNNIPNIYCTDVLSNSNNLKILINFNLLFIILILVCV